jgi:hypothetical protein
MPYIVFQETELPAYEKKEKKVTFDSHVCFKEQI